MGPESTEHNPFEAINAALVPGQAALHALKQLIKELEPIIGPEAAERVREKAEQNIKAGSLPAHVEATILHGLR